MTEAEIEVTQSDREIAASTGNRFLGWSDEQVRMTLDGEGDQYPIVQAFAHYRIAHTAGDVEPVAYRHRVTDYQGNPFPGWAYCDGDLSNPLGLPREYLYAHPPAQAPTDAEAMREACARLVEKRRDDRFAEYGTTEPDTNASYYSGRRGETLEELDEEDEFIAAAIRALPLPKAKASGDVELREALKEIICTDQENKCGAQSRMATIANKALSRPEAGGKEAAGEGEGRDIVERATEIARASYDAIRPTGSKFWGELDDMTQTLAIVSARDALQSLPTRPGVDNTQEEMMDCYQFGTVPAAKQGE